MADTIFKSKEDFVEQYKEYFRVHLSKEYDECTPLDQYTMLARLIAHRARRVEGRSGNPEFAAKEKRVYYFSLEFLIGPLLDNYLLNFGIRDMVVEGLSDLGMDLDTLIEQEVDPGLGNGGLGRLAACFLDSMAAEGIVGCGNGMRYTYGLFKQSIEGGHQIEETDNWLVNGFPWEQKKPSSSVLVRFGGEVHQHEVEGKPGKYVYTWDGGEVVKAVPYDVPIVGFGGERVNRLRLWAAEPAGEGFDLDAFNSGDYAKAFKYRSDVEAISTILYPNDQGEHGRILRLKQEYLFTTAGLQTILRTYVLEHGDDWVHFPDWVRLHTNDTHPAVLGPELMRILVDEKGLEWDEAWDIVTRAVSYTNHTVLPEALEKWPINTYRQLFPRTYMFIDEINRRYLDSLDRADPFWQERARSTAILWDGEVRMANLSIVCSHSVNGVAGLHTEILKRETLRDFYQLTPQKFNNKTNGISHRRFLGTANPELAKLVTEAIGDGWLKDASELKGLEKFCDDASFLERLGEVKRANKVRLAQYVAKSCDELVIDPDSVFDVQVKRFHAYKRQLLNIFKVMDLYNRIKADPSLDVRPTTFIFSGKAASAYFFAKEVIRLINGVADVVNNDPDCAGKIKVVFIPNFAVSNAQLIYPAAEISEQISTAGKEASGTSNMKLMMNGAITLGTYDGANIEISELAGMDNIKIFGLRVEDIERLRNMGYNCWDLYNRDPGHIGRVVNELTDGTFGRLSGDFSTVRDELMVNNDYDLVLADFSAYCRAFGELMDAYGDVQSWNRMALHNIANSGWFSSDRTIREYNRDIWHA